MVTPSTLATAAGLAAAALSSAAAEPASARVRSAAARAASTAAAAGGAAAAAANPLLQDAAAAAILGRAVGLVRGRGPRATVPGYAQAASATPRASSASSSKSALSFLSDPRLSIEEKLMRLLAYLSERWEKEMKSKMDQIAAGEGDTSGTGTAPKTKKSGGIFGKVASAISGVLGADALKSLSGFLKLPGVKAVVGKIAGPVLAAGATALGFPAAAPVLLQYGSRVVDAVAGVADAAGASSATSGTSGAMTDGKRQQLVMEIQRLYEKQKEMFSLVSNILRTSHDTRMTAIGNIR